MVTPSLLFDESIEKGLEVLHLKRMFLNVSLKTGRNGLVGHLKQWLKICLDG